MRTRAIIVSVMTAVVTAGAIYAYNLTADPEAVGEYAQRVQLDRFHPTGNPILDRSDAAELRQRAEGYFRQGQYEAAKKYLLQALEYNEGATHTISHLGATYEKMGERDKAERLYRIVARDYPQAAYNLSRLLESQGRHDEAVCVAVRCHQDFVTAPVMCPTIEVEDETLLDRARVYCARRYASTRR